MPGHRGRSLSRATVPELLVTKARSPLVVVLGSPAEVLNLLAGLGPQDPPPTCYQMDLHQADRLRSELLDRGLNANVVTSGDLWDLPAEHATAVFMPTRGGERELKLDMIEQVWHVLRDHGTFVIWSPYESDPFFPPQLKKVFGRVHTAPHQSGEQESLLWCHREGERQRRRHEVTFQVKISDGPSCRFVSRPGTFSYGRFDLGARALCEVMEVEPGDRVLDLGCGAGTNGVFASQKTGPTGYIAFVDSNARAIALADLNARANGVAQFETFATSTATGPKEDSFDVVLCNPPYFGNSAIAQMFIQRARKLLTPQGRLFVVTKQPEEIGAAVLDHFGKGEVVELRGYAVVCA